MEATGTRPLEGPELRNLLLELARINVISQSLKYEMEPLSEEEVAAEMKPISAEQMAEDLDEIATLVTRIVLEHLKAQPDEWYAANEQIE